MEEGWNRKSCYQIGSSLILFPFPPFFYHPFSSSTFIFSLSFCIYLFIYFIYCIICLGCLCSTSRYATNYDNNLFCLIYIYILVFFPVLLKRRDGHIHIGMEESDPEHPPSLLKYTAKKGAAAIDCLVVLLERQDQSTLFELLKWISVEKNLFKVLQVCPTHEAGAVWDLRYTNRP